MFVSHLLQAPFQGEDEDQIFHAIQNEQPDCLNKLPSAARSIVELLLVKDPRKRIGFGPGDADDIKAHAYFRGVNWDDYLNLRIAPPFAPQIVCSSLDCFCANDSSWLYVFSHH